MSRVRLYGRAAGHGSHAVVTSGFRGVLEKAGLLEGFFPLDLPEEDDAPPGALAHHGVFTGALNMVRQMNMAARHEQKWVVVAPNSSHMPPAIVKELHDSGATCLAPSMWAATVLKNYELPTILVHHGISGEFVQLDRSHVRETYGQGEFTVLHFSTSTGQRKGTLELLQAWDEAIGCKWLPSKAELICVLDQSASSSLLERMVDLEMRMPPQVKFARRFEFSPAQLSAVFGSVHLVCQPSRAEGFGLCPLEALACGVPICATACTGHADYIEAPGVVAVPHGPDVEIDDGPGALAPGINAHDLMRALIYAYERWPSVDGEAGEHAPELRQSWSWESALGPFLTYLR